MLFKEDAEGVTAWADCKEFDGPTSNGSNLVGDSIVLPPLTDPAKSDNVSGLEWNELIEEDVSSVMDGMKGVLSVVVGFWISVDKEPPLVIIGDGWEGTTSTTLVIPCRFLRCLVLSPL